MSHPISNIGAVRQNVATGPRLLPVKKDKHETWHGQETGKPPREGITRNPQRLIGRNTDRQRGQSDRLYYHNRSENQGKNMCLTHISNPFHPFTYKARPLHNPFSLLYMNFLTHTRACSLNPKNSAQGLKQFGICPLAWAVRFARMGAPKSS